MEFTRELTAMRQNHKREITIFTADCGFTECLRLCKITKWVRWPQTLFNTWCVGFLCWTFYFHYDDSRIWKCVRIYCRHLRDFPQIFFYHLYFLFAFAIQCGDEIYFHLNQQQTHHTHTKRTRFFLSRLQIYGHIVYNVYLSSILAIWCQIPKNRSSRRSI